MTDSPAITGVPTADDTPLRVVRVEPGIVILSSGEVLLVKYAKLAQLVTQILHDGSPVTIRTWQTPAGNELVEIHRVDQAPDLHAEPVDLGSLPF